MLEKVMCPTYETFFESTARATPSNKSARLFKAKTMHALNGLNPSDSLRTVNIRIRTDAMRKRTQAVHVKCRALFFDEYSQSATTLYHASMPYGHSHENTYTVSNEKTMLCLAKPQAI